MVTSEAKIMFGTVKSRTVIITLITWRSVTAVYTIWVVTPNMAWVIHQVSITHVVIAMAITALPVLLAAVRVSIPSIRLTRAVQVMATVNWVRGCWWRTTVLIALITDWSHSTFG